MAPASVIKCHTVRSGLYAGARVRPCHEVLTAVAARLDEPADVGAMRLVSKAWNAAATDGTVIARMPKFSAGKPGMPPIRGSALPNLFSSLSRGVNMKGYQGENCAWIAICS